MADYIPRPGKALSAAKDNKNNSRIHIMIIKCFHDYPTIEESSAFILQLIMKCFEDAMVGNTFIS